MSNENICDSDNGTYVFQFECGVNGNPTYSWNINISQNDLWIIIVNAIDAK